MATIITKNSTGSGVTPSSLQQGELAINVVDGRLFYGSGSGNAVKEFTGGGISGGVNKFIPIWTSPTTQGTSSIFQTGSFTAIRYSGSPEDPLNPETLYVNGAGTNSYNIISAHSDLNSYVQINAKNYNSGSNASTDIVATRNDGNETSGFIDMGINSSLYSNTSFVGSAGDAYLYSTGENLLIGNATPNKQLVLFNGGTDAAANARVYIHDQGTVSINSSEVGPDPTNPPALYIHPTPIGASNFNMVIAEANVDNYAQIAILNNSAGSFASADIVAQNDLGTETDHYVDMGINSSTHGIDYSFTVGEANDTYMLSVSTGGNHYIGSSKSSDIYLFTGANFDGKTHAKLLLRANNHHQMSGSLSISGSGTLTNGLTITGSFIASGSGGRIYLNGSVGALYDSNGNTSLEWSTGRNLWNSAGTSNTVDWDNTNLNDSASVTSINWSNRSITNPQGSEAFNWSDEVVSYSNIYHKQESRVGAEGELLSNTRLRYSGQALYYPTFNIGCVVGHLIFLDSDGIWYPVDQSLTSAGQNMLGIYLDNKLVLLEGDVVLDKNDVDIKASGFGIGRPIYIHQGTGDGTMNGTIPTSGIVRVIGQCYYQNSISTNNVILKFRPSNDYYSI